ncbi:6057_t:CDS:2, partial [Gigaspora margarita]
MAIMALDTFKFEWSIPTIKNNAGPNIALRRFASILIWFSQKNNYEWITFHDLKPFQLIPTTTISSVTSSASPSNNITIYDQSNNVIAIIGIAFGAIADNVINCCVSYLEDLVITLFFAPQDGELNNKVS